MELATMLLVLTAAMEDPAALASSQPRYAAYWLTKEGAGSSYGAVLVARLPLSELVREIRIGEIAAGPQPSRTPAPPILDHVALTISTYMRDSIWNDDRRPLKPVLRFKDLDEKAKTAEVNGVRYHYEACPIDEVVRLLRTPLGKEPIHRIYPPLGGMEQTARGLRLILEEQLKEEASKK